MNFYFYLQYQRIKRWLKEQSIPLLVGIIVLGIFFYATSYILFLKVNYAQWVYVGGALLFIVNYGMIAEKSKLSVLYTKSQLIRINIIEHLIIQLPFLLYLLFKEVAFWAALVLLLGAVILAFFDLNTHQKIRIPTLFKKRPFEYIVGFRKTFLFTILAYIIAVKALQVHNFQLGLFMLGVLFFQGMSFYSQPENPYFVWIFKYKPKAFLWFKIKTALINATIISFPLIILLLIGFPSKTIWIIATQILGYLFLSSMILAKYASFPNQIGLPQALLYGLSLWFPPLLILIMILFYRRSIHQLNEILS